MISTKKRYIKILPFFALLVLIDVVFSGCNINSIYEGFSDLTLLFGFFPAPNITVIGVGWTLGVIFAFYCLFPFFVFAIWNKKRAWISLIISLGINYVCTYYFLVDDNAISSNLMRWICYFIAGGIIYLYRENISNVIGKHKIIVLCSIILITLSWWYICDFNTSIPFINTLLTIIMFSSWVAYAISVKSVILANKATAFISDISFEIYLAHMMIFRVLEKLKLVYLFGDNTLSYLLFSILVVLSAIIFSVVTKKSIDYILNFSKYRGLKK